jgi:adenylate cyclase
VSLSFRQIRITWSEQVNARLPAPVQAIVLSMLTIGVASTTITAIVNGTKQMGWLQALELRAYDRLVRLQLDGGPDPRLLIVAITEDDIRLQKRYPPSDQSIAQAMATLQRYQPAAIGLDLYRDVPQGSGQTKLLHQLQSGNTIAITKLSDNEATRIPPPPKVPLDQIGFNDFPIDLDGVVRRTLLFATADTKTYYSFSLRLALRYLANHQIQSQRSSINSTYLQLGTTTFVPIDADAGGYQSLDDAGYQILLRYRSQRSIAREVTLTEVLENQVDPTWVKGKIVLIGTTAPSGKDLFYTPYSAGEEKDHLMPGIEVHAQMVSHLLNTVLNHQPLFWFWPNWGELIWIWGWAISGGAIAWWIRHPLVLGLSSAVLLTLLGGCSLMLFIQQAWVPVVSPMIALLLTAGTVVTYRAQQAQQQQQMVMTLLGQNASPEIAAALWNYRDRLLQSGKLPGQKLVATMLFTDLRNFSGISERTPPETLLDWLNEYLEAMTQAIQINHGIVNKFTGDGLLAVFGVPVPRSSAAEIALDAARAVSCALEMGDRLEQLNQDWQQRGLTTLQMRVGIFTGPVVVGSLGGKNRMEYGVIGDSVNIASRLESCAKDRQSGICRILIAHETLTHIQGQFQVEPWGLMELKGKQQMVEVYRVLSKVDHPQVKPELTSDVSLPVDELGLPADEHSG